jgi:ATP-dependent DNA ligase
MIQLKLRRLYPVDVMLFDIIEWDNQRLESDPLMNRHNLLTSLYSTYSKAVAGQPKHVQLTPNYLDVDTAWNEWVVKRHEEGLMAKDPMSPYVYERSSSWLKVKIRDSGTFHVVGYTAGDGNRSDTFGALILADDAGVCRGRCGGGFSWAAQDSTARQILQALKQAPVINQPYPESEVGLPYTAVDTKMQVKVAFLKTFNGSSKLRSPQLIDWWIPQ